MKKTLLTFIATLMFLLTLPAKAENQTLYYSMWIKNNTPLHLKVLNISGPESFEVSSANIGDSFKAGETLKLNLSHHPDGAGWIVIGENFPNSIQATIYPEFKDGKPLLDLSNQGRLCASKYDEWKTGDDLIYEVTIQKCK
jgi:hypothetical protein